MLKLTAFAAIARQYGVGFSVEFTASASYAVVAGSVKEWHDCPFYVALRKTGSGKTVPASATGHRLHNSREDMWFQLESLT